MDTCQESPSSQQTRVMSFLFKWAHSIKSSNFFTSKLTNLFQRQSFRFFDNQNHLIKLTDLLPYTIETKPDLRNGLIEYELLLTASIEALNCFISRDLKKFDPIVGENACQVRAIMIAILATKKNIRLSDLLLKIKETHKKIGRIINNCKYIQQLYSSRISLAELLEVEKLTISLTNSEKFIIEAFILTESKSSDSERSSICIIEKIDPKKLKKFGATSVNFSRNLVSKLRRSIAYSSVQFARKIASNINDLKLQSMLADERTILHNNHLLCTPMFWTYKSMIHAAQIEKIPFILHVKFVEGTQDHLAIIDTEYLYYEYSCNDLKLASKLKTDKPACVIEGIVHIHEKNQFSKIEWRKKIQRFSLFDIILAGAADHRQYPCSLQEKIFDDVDNSFFKFLAKIEGFSLQNPSTFFIQHIYPCYADKLISSSV